MTQADVKTHSTGDSPRRVQAVERTLDLLEALVESRGRLSATELSLRSGLPYSTVHRLLGGLVRRGYAGQDPRTKTYSVGARLIGLSSQCVPKLAEWIEPLLANLVTLSGETASLAVLHGDTALYVAQVQSRRKLRTFAEVGYRVPTHSSAVGKVLLAASSIDEVMGIIRRRGLAALTPTTITDAPTLLNELDEVKLRGFAIDDEEAEIGVRCVAVPVRLLGKTLAAISISGPGTRITAERQGTLAARMIEEVGSFVNLLEPDAEVYRQESDTNEAGPSAAPG